MQRYYTYYDGILKADDQAKYLLFWGRPILFTEYPKHYMDCSLGGGGGGGEADLDQKGPPLILIQNIYFQPPDPKLF